MFEKERKRTEGGRKGALRVFTASQSDPGLSEQVAMEAEQEEAQELGAAAPAEEGNKKYLEDQKKKREKAKSHAKDRGEEEKRKRRGQDISDEAEESIGVRKWNSLSEMTPEDFHKVIKQQDREIREPKQDKQRQTKNDLQFSQR